VQEACSDDEPSAPPTAQIVIQPENVPATLLGIEFDDSDGLEDDDEDKISSSFRVILDPGSDVAINRQVGQQYAQLIVGGLNIIGSKKRL
jgi:hypothetical protein